MNSNDESDNKILIKEPPQPLLNQTQEKTPNSTTGFFSYSPKEWEVLVNAIGEQFVNVRTAETKEISKVTQPVFWLVGILIAAVTFLAYLKIISGESVTFFVGLVCGALISFLGRYLIAE